LYGEHASSVATEVATLEMPEAADLSGRKICSEFIPTFNAVRRRKGYFVGLIFQS
jgi:hypothetical protein